MAIILKNGAKVGAQTAPTPIAESKPTVLPVRNVVATPHHEPEKPTSSRRFVIEKKKVNGVASEDTTLVVNGKQKSIGRKSHYLLDMLTLDDE
jgi:hypothetical protein